MLGIAVAANGAALDWKAESGYRYAEVNPASTEKVGFRQVAPEVTGIFFTNQLSKAYAATNRILENGSGVALGDIDGDGWCDIYFCGLVGDNALYRNLGNWKFEDITREAGLVCPQEFSTGAVFADIDGDHDLDLLVNSIGGGTRLFLNEGARRFREANQAGLVRQYGCTSMALADVEGDGDLDLYVATYRTTNYKDAPPGVKPDIKKVDGKIVALPEDRFITLPSRLTEGVRMFEIGEPDLFYRNDGKGNFQPVSWTDGQFVDEQGKALTAPPPGWGLSVMFRDINADGAPDIYVCNDFMWSPDHVWINDSAGRFKAIDKLALRNMSMSSMGIDFADINRDGFEDFFVVDMLSRDPHARQRQRANLLKDEITLPIQDPEYRPEIVRNTLYLNRGDGTYAEIACLSGLEATEWSWCPIFLDVDLDGYEDVLITTGNLHDVLDADSARRAARQPGDNTAERRLKHLQTYPSLDRPNLAFRNQRDLTFADYSREWGFDFNGLSHGIALGDLDNDGDLDVVMNNMNSAAGVYENQCAAPRLAVRLKGVALNTRGIGAKTRVNGGVALQSQEMIAGGRYLSCDDAMRVFAGGSTNELTIEVAWRSGKRSVVKGVKANRIYEIEEATSTGPRTSSSAAAPMAADEDVRGPMPLFEDASHLLNHTHHEEPFDDFERQPLLPDRLSEQGPGVAWHDLNGDGCEDLIIGTGRGGQLAVFSNDCRGGFVALREAPFTNAVPRDLAGLVGWAPTPGAVTLMAAMMNYEEALTTNPAVRIYNLRARSVQEALGRQVASAGPLALADMDGDGHLECFVGGRVLPRGYPETVASRIYQNVGGQLRLHPQNTRLLETAGMVTSAVFSDLTGSGLPDLLLACEWGPIRVFRNEQGTLREITHELGFSKYLGRWNGITTGDFNGDGRLDVVACNWGRNTKYQRYMGRPWRLVFGDFNGDSAMHPIETFFDKARDKWLPWRDFETVAGTLPFVAERFTTFSAYGGASIEEILGEAGKAARELRLNTVDSMMFLNRTNSFEALPLPVEAQFAPAFGVTVADFNGDGAEDMFLAQNFFAVDVETPRYDGGRGLLLLGNGRGGFTSAPGQESGIKIYAEQRGCAAADYDSDGRTDLVSTQNGGQTKLYHNVGAKPGLRVRLKGPPANAAGVGAVLRLVASEVPGPAREIHAGSGYLSQDSAVQVLNLAKSNADASIKVSVRWPGGKTTLSEVPAGAKEIEIDQAANVKRVR